MKPLSCWPAPALSAGLTLLVALLPITTHGHQLRAAITTVAFNTRTDTLEVIHRFFVHDAEHALTLLQNRPADIIDSADSRQRFGAYVYDRFILKRHDREHLPLSLVGVELDGDYLWVYEQTPIPADLDRLRVANTMLRDVWPEQVNTVNVERSGTVHTLVFSGSTNELEVTFASP